MSERASGSLGVMGSASVCGPKARRFEWLWKPLSFKESKYVI